MPEEAQTPAPAKKGTKKAKDKGSPSKSETPAPPTPTPECEQGAAPECLPPEPAEPETAAVESVAAAETVAAEREVTDEPERKTSLALPETVESAEQIPPELVSPRKSLVDAKPIEGARESEVFAYQEMLQKLEEKAAKATEALERETKAKKELEGLYAKLLAEKTDLLSSLEGEKGSLSETQERASKLQAQKSDLESQLAVSFASF